MTKDEPYIPLSELESLLYNESSVIDPGDVSAFMLVVCKEARAEGDRAKSWLSQFKKELEAQITPQT